MVKKNSHPKNTNIILHWALFCLTFLFTLIACQFSFQHGFWSPKSFYFAVMIFLQRILQNKFFILVWIYFLIKNLKCKLDFCFTVYLNGGHDLPSLTSSGPGSITEELPPDLPLLPPMMPMMQTAPPPMMYPADNRPAPLGRRSPPHGGRGGRYSRSPSPTYGENR